MNDNIYPVLNRNEIKKLFIESIDLGKDSYFYFMQPNDYVNKFMVTIKIEKPNYFVDENGVKWKRVEDE